MVPLVVNQQQQFSLDHQRNRLYIKYGKVLETNFLLKKSKKLNFTESTINKKSIGSRYAPVPVDWVPSPTGIQSDWSPSHDWYPVRLVPSHDWIPSRDWFTWQKCFSFNTWIFRQTTDSDSSTPNTSNGPLSDTFIIETQIFIFTFQDLRI